MDTYKEKTSSFRCEINVPSIPVQLPIEQLSVYESRKDAWMQAITVIQISQAVVSDIEIDCRFHTSLGDPKTWEQIFSGILSVRYNNLQPTIQIHFVYVPLEMIDEIVSFMSAFDARGRGMMQYFNYKIAPVASLVKK